MVIIKCSYLNIGVGGNSTTLKDRGNTIHDYWEDLIDSLHTTGLIQNRSFNPQGYIYPLRGADQLISRAKIYLVGDSAGLATLDMGEGIGPAIRSGILAAESILGNTPYSAAEILKYSLLLPVLRWFLRKFINSEA